MGVILIALTPRQEKIAEIVRLSGPITGEQIAEQLNVTRAALRSDLAILVMTGLIDARPKVGYYYTGKSTATMMMQAIEEVKVRDIQSVPVVVSTGVSAYEAIVTLFLEDVGTLFAVEEGGILAGVISRKDLLKAAMGNNNLQQIPVKVLMTPLPKIVMVLPEDSILTAAKRMIDNEVDSLPVVRELKTSGHPSMEVIGRVTKTNITRLFVEFGEGKRR